MLFARLPDKNHDPKVLLHEQQHRRRYKCIASAVIRGSCLQSIPPCCAHHIDPVVYLSLSIYIYTLYNQ